MTLLFAGRVIGLAILLLSPAAASAQESCPDGFPVDCGTGSCCQAGTYCLPEGGCAPLGWSSCGGGSICPPGTNIYCPRVNSCYSTYEAASADGCTFEETTICGVPQ